MKKIPTLFERIYDNNGRITDIIAIYGMYKRDFHERLKNKPTWNKQTFDMKEVIRWE